MDSLGIKRFSQTLINYINSVQLPPECKRLVLLEIMGQVESACEEAIQNELRLERAEKEKEEQTE